MVSTQAEIGRFFRHSAVYVVGNALNRLGAFLLLPAYTNYLTVAEYGALELFSTVAAVITGILSMGLAHATLRFYFEYPDEPRRNAVVSTNLIASFAITVAGVALIAPWEEPLMSTLFPGTHYHFGFWLILASLVLELSSQVCLAYLRAREYSVFFVAIALAKLVIQIVANVTLLVVYRAGVEGVLLGNLIAVAIGWLVLALFTLGRCGLAFQVDKLMPVLEYSLPFLLATLVGIVSRNVDRLLVSGLLSLEALGLYSLALKFSKLTTDLIGEPFSRAYGAFRFSVMDRPDAGAIQGRILRYLAAFLAVIGLGIVYFTRDVLRVMTDAKFWPAAGLLPPLVLAAILQVLNHPLQTGFLYRKATRHIFHVHLLQALVASAGAFALISAFGLAGACVTPLLVATTTIVQTHRFSQRYFPVVYEYRRLGWLGLLTLAFYLLGLPLARLPPAGSVGGKGLLLALFVATLLRSPVFDRDELRLGRAFLHARWTSLRAGGAA